MTSFRQEQANRRNALHSTGPRTEEGKRASRANAFRHGLTAETIVTGVEDAEDYRAFEAAVIADYDARTAVERELVLRLASLLWRLRRATAVETDLLEIQAQSLRERQIDEAAGGSAGQSQFSSAKHAHLFPVAINSASGPSADRLRVANERSYDFPDHAVAIRTLTYAFLRLAQLDSGIFERLGRYEARLWSCSRSASRLLKNVT